MVINGKNFPVNLVEDRAGYWARFGAWNDDTSWDIVSEEDMLMVTKWCEEHECRKRMSYDMFQFKTRKDLEFFMLKWG